MVAQALNKVIHQNHGLVKNNQRIKKIIVEGGEAKGVEMINGTVYHASQAVISTIDPIQTFIDLMDGRIDRSDFDDLWTELSDKAPVRSAAASGKLRCEFSDIMDGLADCLTKSAWLAVKWFTAMPPIQRKIEFGFL